MARTSQTGYLRQYGTPGKSGTPAVFLSVIQFSFDPTAASTGTGKILPNGSIPLFVQNMNGGATGGTSPTIDVGITGLAGGFANELAADAKSGLDSSGTLLGNALGADVEIFAGVGASAATGGTVSAALYYIMVDNGSA